MVKTLQNKLAKARKNKKGFTLVELIVVIVILAILIGVTIGGIYRYVGQSRTNTDKNNDSAIESTLSTVGTLPEVYSWANGDAEVTAEIKVPVAGVASDSIAFSSGKAMDTEGKALAEIKSLFPNGLPEQKGGNQNGYTITIKGAGKSGNGAVSVTCNLDAGGDAK